MINQSAKPDPVKAYPKVRIILPGWADEASAIPHPAPLLESVENALARIIADTTFELSAIPGALCRWSGSDTETPAPDKLVCADPVHLVAGSDDAQLIPAQRLSVTADENIALLSELNQMLGDEQGSFLHDFAGNWYYQGMAGDALNAAPSSAVEGHPMTAAMPRTDAARPWRSLWSEVQMVLHQSPVNTARQHRGEPVINSVWFWGGGALPAMLDKRLGDEPSSEPGNLPVVFCDDHVARGLCKAWGITAKPLSAFESEVISEHSDHHYVVLDTQLLQGNPDFVDQLEVGKQWALRIEAMGPLNAEIDGLTGSREVFVPASPKSVSVLSRLAQMFQR